MTFEPPHQIVHQFYQKDGIWLPRNNSDYGSPKQKQLWDKIGQNYYNRRQFETATPPDYAEVIRRPSGLWNKFPAHQHFSTILEIGCGDGRASIHLSKNRNLSCEVYYGIDISEPQLRRLQIFKQAYNFYPSARFVLVCMSVRQLPLADNSVDLVISDSVFMHLAKKDTETLFSEIARTLKPHGVIGLRNSFHNRDCIGHIIHNLIRQLAPNRNAIYLQQYSLSEIKTLFENSGLTNKIGSIKVKSDGQYVLIPRHIGKQKVPLARCINDYLKRSGIRSHCLIYSFDAYNW
ncbi:class I SAM-dependent methyltransferase [Sphaerothrix gracilis]|uniref:class I SAM-dependent methyltransferase n=1 Tax=Sphaerothrix gracilis TaxID=3151835 RepID=UPI0031FDAD90